MCLMCVEIQKGRMTIQEGRRALRELIATATKKEDRDHYQQLFDASDDEFLDILENSDE